MVLHRLDEVAQHRRARPEALARQPEPRLPISVGPLRRRRDRGQRAMPPRQLVRAPILPAARPQRHASRVQGDRERAVLSGGHHPAAPDRDAAGVRDAGGRPLIPAGLGQRVVIDQPHRDADVPGRRGLRREVSVRAARTQRVAGHEEQHPASMERPGVPSAS